MSLVAGDEFDSSQPWWLQYRASLLVGGAPSFVDGACRLATNSGGSGNGLWFNNSDGLLRYQWNWGDFDFFADVQVRNAALSALPPTGAARLALIAVHDPVRVPSGSGLSSSINEFHVGVGYVTGGGQDPTGNTLLIEWKRTVNSSSLFNTVSIPAGGAGAQGRVLLRLRREGSIFTAFVAPVDLVNELRVPAPSEWTQVVQQTIASIRTLTQVGIKVYSSSASANVGGVFRRFANYSS